MRCAPSTNKLSATNKQRKYDLRVVILGELLSGSTFRICATDPKIDRSEIDMKTEQLAHAEEALKLAADAARRIQVRIIRIARNSVPEHCRGIRFDGISVQESQAKEIELLKQKLVQTEAASKLAVAEAKRLHLQAVADANARMSSAKANEEKRKDGTS